MAPIPAGSTVLVTGANGYLASHIIDQLLSQGYPVKGSVRSLERGSWLKTYFSKLYPSVPLTLEIVPDVAAPGAFDHALEDVAGVVHVASDLSFSSDPAKVIPGVEAAITNILESTAAKGPSIKRVVLTSSSSAAIFPITGTKDTIAVDSWNDVSVAKAWHAEEEGRAYHVYAASKVASEKALWRFVKERKPKFEVNAVLPNLIMGKVLGREWGQSGSTGGAVVNLYAGDEKQVEGSKAFLNQVPPRKFYSLSPFSPLIRSFALASSISSFSCEIFSFTFPHYVHL